MRRPLGIFIFEEILCRWGRVAEIMTDNGPAFVVAAAYLSEKYSIHHIKISPYNCRQIAWCSANTSMSVNP